VDLRSASSRTHTHASKGVLYRVYSDTTQLNSTAPVEQRTAKSVVFLFMTSRPTNWVNWVTTFIDRWQLFALWTCRQLDVELSCVAINTPWFSLTTGQQCNGLGGVFALWLFLLYIIYLARSFETIGQILFLMTCVVVCLWAKLLEMVKLSSRNSLNRIDYFVQFLAKWSKIQMTSRACSFEEPAICD